jgi:photosystem II stability/assembly factor-like uncharacterized protein
MSILKSWKILLFIIIINFILIVPVYASTVTTYYDYDSFSANTTNLTPITFDELTGDYYNSPLSIGDIIFSINNGVFRTDYVSALHTDIVPVEDNPIRIQFPAHTGAVGLLFRPIGLGPTGNNIGVDVYDTDLDLASESFLFNSIYDQFIGFDSSAGISEINISSLQLNGGVSNFQLLDIYYEAPAIAEPTWTQQRLTHNPGHSYIPSIAIDSSDNIYVVWADNTPGKYEIYFKKSTDGGSTWTQQRLTRNSGWPSIPSIAIDSLGVIYVVWDDGSSGNFEIYLKKSTDGGSTWTQQRLTGNSGSSGGPSIAMDSSDNVYVVWMDETPGNWEIYLMKSTDGGSTWTQQRLTQTSGDSLVPKVAMDSSDNIYVVWIDETRGNWEIYLKKSTDGGSTWTQQRLTRNSGYSYHPSIAIDSSDNIYVVWDDDTPGNYEIYLKKSTDGGSIWTQQGLTRNSGDSWHPSIAMDGSDNVYVVWDDDTLGNGEIYLKKSTDGGSTWTQQRLTRNSGDSRYPSIAMDSSDNVYVVWEDDTPGNYEIYLKSTN